MKFEKWQKTWSFLNWEHSIIDAPQHAKNMSLAYIFHVIVSNMLPSEWENIIYIYTYIKIQLSLSVDKHLSQ